MDYTGELIINNDTSVIGSGHKNKKYYKIQYVANGSNGKIAFFSFVNDPDQLYLIKVQGKGEYMIDYIEHEYFILNYLKSKVSVYQQYIMGIEYGFQSVDLINGILYNPDNFTNLTGHLENCFLSKAMSSNTSLGYLIETKQLNETHLQKFNVFLYKLLYIRNTYLTPGFCHNDFHSENILYDNIGEFFFLVDFGRAYVDVTDEEKNNILKDVLDVYKENSNTFNCQTSWYKFSPNNINNLWCDFAGLISKLFEKNNILLYFINTNILMGNIDKYQYIHRSWRWYNEYLFINKEVRQYRSGQFYAKEYNTFMDNKTNQTKMNDFCANLKKSENNPEFINAIEKENDLLKRNLENDKLPSFTSNGGRRTLQLKQDDTTINNTLETWKRWSKNRTQEN